MSIQTKTLLGVSLRGLALAALPLVALHAVADDADVPAFAGVWQVAFGNVAAGQTLLDELPDDVVLIDDAGGGELGEGDFGGLTLSAAARAEVAAYDFTEELKRENTCTAPTVIVLVQAPFPMQIHQGRDLLVFQHEYFDMTRVIHLNETEPLPVHAPHTKTGHSVGSWEGDTLVVETTHIAAGSFANNGLSHSENIHLEERFRLSPDGQTLWLTQLYEDPEVFAEKAARFIVWRRDPGGVIYPYDCDPSYGYGE